MKIPHIKVKPPGPKAQELIQRDERYTAPAYGRVYPLAVKAGQGMAIEDVDGNFYLDFTAGIAVASTGHSHPKVVAAIEEQARRFLHYCGSDYYYESMAQLAEKLSELAPGSSDKKVFFTNSGTEAVEAAIKLARYATKRSHLIAFLGAFHGRTLGSLSLTASRASHRAGFGPLLPDVHHAPYGLEGLDFIESQIFAHEAGPQEVAAIFVEPVQGEGGYIVPPATFLPALKELCRRHGILLVADEIQSGFGRTGKMFACEHWDVEPDILCVAKGIASGLPLGAMIARADISTWKHGNHGSTFGGNPVACAAALATIELIENGLMANAGEMGGYLKEKLSRLKTNKSPIRDVRGLGLMVGVEFATSDQRDRAVLDAFEKGLLLLGCGERVIRFCPPLIVSKSDIDAAIEIFSAVVK
jgi:4-aminobutyrate aminotransferase